MEAVDRLAFLAHLRQHPRVRKAELEAEAAMVRVYETVDWNSYEIPANMGTRELPWLQTALAELRRDPSLRRKLLERALEHESISDGSWAREPELSWLSVTYEIVRPYLR